MGRVPGGGPVCRAADSAMGRMAGQEATRMRATEWVRWLFREGRYYMYAAGVPLGLGLVAWSWAARDVGSAVLGAADVGVAVIAWHWW